MQTIFNKGDEFVEASRVRLFHGGYITLSDGVTCLNQLNLRPFWQRVISGAQKNIGDESCVSAIAIFKWMNAC